MVVNLTLGDTLGSHSSVGNDSILGGVNAVRGSNFADSITGTTGGEILDGLGGTDTLNGDAGNDRLVGGGGDDAINGGADFDIAVFTGCGANTASRRAPTPASRQSPTATWDVMASTASLTWSSSSSPTPIR